MSVLVDKTGRLGENARDFRVRSRTLKRRMWWKNVKLMVLLTLVVIFLIYLFVGFGCGLPGKFTVDGRNPCALSLLHATVSSHAFLPPPVPLVDISRRCSLSVCIRLPCVDGDTLKASTFVTRDFLEQRLTNSRLGTLPRSLESRQQTHETTGLRHATGPSRRAYDVFRSFDAITQSLTTSRVGNLFIVYTKGEASGVFPIISSNYYPYFRSHSMFYPNSIDSVPCRSPSIMPLVGFPMMHRDTDLSSQPR